MNGKQKRLIVVVGPTAIGKTAMAIKIAQHFDTEIVSCDSRQFYKELNIGVARPTETELAMAKHYFIANASIQEPYNVSTFEHEALKKLDELFLHHDDVIAVGGSGLYVDALCNGIAIMPDPDPEIRQQLKQQLNNEGIESLRAMLKILDPEYYENVDLANHARLIRALEMCLTTGKPFSQIRKQELKIRPFEIVKIALNCNREELYNRINQRVDIMMEAGLEKEVSDLYQYKDLTALNTVGYKELFDYIDSRCTLEQAVTEIKTHTRRYAKRQLTWFQRFNEIKWFERNNFFEILQFLDNK